MVNKVVTTIDAKEKHKFSKLAGEWWEEGGHFSILHKLTPLRIEYIVDYISRYFKDTKPLRILDVGCGGGLASIPLARLGNQVLGIDMVAENTAEAARYAQLHNVTGVEFYCSSIEELQDAQPFDVILGLEVIEHVADMRLFVELLCKRLKSNGLLFVSTLNQNLYSYLAAILGAEYILGWVPVGTHDWEKFVTPEQLNTLLCQQGIEVLDATGICYNPMLGSWYLGESTMVNYILCGIKRGRK